MNKLYPYILAALVIYIIMFRAIVFSQLNYLNSEIDRIDRFCGAVYKVQKGQ